MKKIFFYFSILAIIVGLFVLNKMACNNPGSIAEKINWAGHNCSK